MSEKGLLKSLLKYMCYFKTYSIVLKTCCLVILLLLCNYHLLVIILNKQI